MSNADASCPSMWPRARPVRERSFWDQGFDPPPHERSSFAAACRQHHTIGVPLGLLDFSETPATRQARCATAGRLERSRASAGSRRLFRMRRRVVRRRLASSARVPKVSRPLAPLPVDQAAHARQVPQRRPGPRHEGVRSPAPTQLLWPAAFQSHPRRASRASAHGSHCPSCALEVVSRVRLRYPWNRPTCR